MKIQLLLVFTAAMLLASCGTTKNSGNDLATATPIDSQINLTQVQNDKVPVTIDPGRFTIETVTYRLPKSFKEPMLSAILVNILMILRLLIIKEMKCQ